jgi:hypothetical protein
MSVAPDTQRRVEAERRERPNSPATDRGLERTAGKQNRTGLRLLALGGVMLALGLLLVIVGENLANFAGLALIGLSMPPGMAGLALVLSGVVGKRSAQHKPFA